MLIELSQSVQEKCYMISYVESDEHNKVTNKSNRSLDTQNRLIAARKEGWGT